MTWTAPADYPTGKSLTSLDWNLLLGKHGSLQYLYNNANFPTIKLTSPSNYLTINVPLTITWSDILNITDDNQFVQVNENDSNIIFLKSGFYLMKLETIIGNPTFVNYTFEFKIIENSTWTHCWYVPSTKSGGRMSMLSIVYISNNMTNAYITAKQTVSNYIQPVSCYITAIK